jgi:hypothetical protein
MGRHNCIPKLAAKTLILGDNLWPGFIPTGPESFGKPTEQTKEGTYLTVRKIGLEFL